MDGYVEVEADKHAPLPCFWVLSFAFGCVVVSCRFLLFSCTPEKPHSSAPNALPYNLLGSIMKVARVR